MLARKMYSFPGAAVTNYHELVGLKQHNFFFLVLGAWKSKIKVLARLVSLGASERESVLRVPLTSGGGQKHWCSLCGSCITAVSPLSSPCVLHVCVCLHRAFL